MRTKIGENQTPALDEESCALLQELLYKASGGIPTDKLIFDDQGDFDGDVACFSSEALVPPQTSVSDDMEEVKRELNEAIQKDMELPSMINAHDEFFDQNQNAEDALYGGSRSPRSVEEGEPAKEAPKPEKAGKEIVLNAEQFKMIQ